MCERISVNLSRIQSSIRDTLVPEVARYTDSAPKAITKILRLCGMIKLIKEILHPLKLVCFYIPLSPPVSSFDSSTAMVLVLAGASAEPDMQV